MTDFTRKYSHKNFREKEQNCTFSLKIKIYPKNFCEKDRCKFKLGDDMIILCVDHHEKSNYYRYFKIKLIILHLYLPNQFTFLTHVHVQ